MLRLRLSPLDLGFETQVVCALGFLYTVKEAQKEAERVREGEGEAILNEHH